MDIEEIFNKLESSKSQDCEEAKKTLTELFSQNKEQWMVQNMMDYIHKTGSFRVMEVLVKVQSMDTFILDKLDEWLRTHSHRTEALNLFSFLVRMHPTWLFKVEKHRLFKSLFKLLTTEKEIVPLMSALLCIITLLPIIPSLVPNFFAELFDVFGHLASWNCQNPNRLSDDKLVHLQLGLQMLFHRLYGMYPCNFLAFITEYIKKEKGAIFHHTIKPLLETIRVHPMLVTATVESEVNIARWKDMEPHDVVMECAKMSLPVVYQDSISEIKDHLDSDLLDTPGGYLLTPIPSGIRTSITTTPCTNIFHRSISYGAPNSRFDSSNNHRFNTSNSSASGTIWSPYNEIVANPIPPLTPTPSYMVPQAASNSSQLLSVTGTSPPEAAVEATPETTPMKDARLVNRSSGPNTNHSTNPLAVRAIFAGSSQPSSPLRKEPNHFVFADLSTARTPSYMNQRLQQVIKDQRQTATANGAANNIFSVQGEEPDSDLAVSEINASSHNNETADELLQEITKICDNCNETESSRCTAGGLHIPTSHSFQVLAKGIKRRQRQRMTSYCCNEQTSSVFNKTDAIDSDATTAIGKMRRTKSCSSICVVASSASSTAGDVTDDDSGATDSVKAEHHRLQKSAKMMTIATVKKRALVTKLCNIGTQTVGMEPNNYEVSLFESLSESNHQRSNYENNQLSPNEILNQYIMHAIKSENSYEGGNHRADQDQYKLLCVQLEYERYRREVYAERNRRLMGRNRDKRSLEMERDRLRDQLKYFALQNNDLTAQIERTKKTANEREQSYKDELAALKIKYQHELEQNKCLQQANENLQARLNEELSNRKETNYQLEEMKGQIFNMNAELQHAEQQAEMGNMCKQELARLETEFIIMGEVQIKCRDRLAELDSYQARDEEHQMLQESCATELRDIKQALQEKSSQLDSLKHKIIDLQNQLKNSEKINTEQKRMLTNVKNEYDEAFQALNRKYEVQKIIILQMEEKIVMSLHKPQKETAVNLNACSPDADKTDAASADRNSPLSTSLASSESLSASLRSTELRNLQQLVETPLDESGITGSVEVSIGANIIEGTPIQTLDLASSANTATASNMSNAINIVMGPSTSSTTVASNFEVVTAANILTNSSQSHSHLYQQQPNKLSSSSSSKHQQQH